MADAKGLSFVSRLPYCPSSSSAAVVSFAIDAATDKVEWVFQIGRADTITIVGFRYALRTGTPVQHRIGLQAIDASGNPDGTFLGGGSPASATFTPPADGTWDNTWQWVTLDNSYLTSRGELLALVIEPVGTPDGSNNSQFTTSSVNLGSRQGFPYAIHTNAGSRSRQSSGPIFAVRSATLTYGQPLLQYFQTQISSNSDPDEYAIKFTYPAGFSDTHTCVGVRVNCRMSAVTKSLKVILYDGTTAIQEITWDGDVGNTSDFRSFEFYFTDATLDTLTFGNTYRIGFQPQDTGNNFTLHALVLPDAASRSAYPGGDILEWSQRTDLGAWDDSMTDMIPIGSPIFDDITESAGGGGGGPSSMVWFG